MRSVALVTLIIMAHFFAIGQTLPQAHASGITINPNVKSDTSLSSKYKSGTPGAGVIVRICAPRKGALLQPPLYVIISRNKEFKMLNNDAFKDINPQAIQAVTVLKDSAAVNKYGNEAKYGVILITVNDAKYPKLYKEIKKASKAGKK